MNKTSARKAFRDVNQLSFDIYDTGSARVPDALVEEFQNFALDKLVELVHEEVMKHMIHTYGWYPELPENHLVYKEYFAVESLTIAQLLVLLAKRFIKENHG